MKLTRIFGLVLAIHLVVVAALLVQPGCQTTDGRNAPARPRGNAPLESAAPTAAVPVDDEFNAGMNRQAPTRPEGGSLASDFNSGYAPGEVLEPLGANSGPAPELKTYEVQRGDTLSRIATRNGITLAELLAANGLNRSSTIFPGQKLTIPAATTSQGSLAPTPVGAEEGQAYVVKSGDALAKIARRFNVTVASIKAANSMTSDVIRVGQRLIIPSSGTGMVAPTPSAAAAPIGGSGQTYTVKRGDAISTIARRFGVSQGSLMAVNNINDPRSLQAGQVLVLPVGASEAPSGSSAPAPSTSQPVASTPRQTTTAPATSGNTVVRRSNSAPVEIPPSASTTVEPAPSSNNNPFDALESLDDEPETPTIPVQEGGDEAVPLDDSF